MWQWPFKRKIAPSQEWIDQKTDNWREIVRVTAHHRMRRVRDATGVAMSIDEAFPDGWVERVAMAALHTRSAARSIDVIEAHFRERESLLEWRTDASMV